MKAIIALWALLFTFYALPIAAELDVAVGISTDSPEENDGCCWDYDGDVVMYRPYYSCCKRYTWVPVRICQPTIRYITKPCTRRVYYCPETDCCGCPIPTYYYETYYKECPVYIYEPTVVYRKKRVCDCNCEWVPCKRYDRYKCQPPTCCP